MRGGWLLLTRRTISDVFLPVLLLYYLYSVLPVNLCRFSSACSSMSTPPPVPFSPSLATEAVCARVVRLPCCRSCPPPSARMTMASVSFPGPLLFSPVKTLPQESSPDISSLAQPPQLGDEAWLGPGYVRGSVDEPRSTQRAPPMSGAFSGIRKRALEDPRRLDAPRQPPAQLPLSAPCALFLAGCPSPDMALLPNCPEHGVPLSRSNRSPQPRTQRRTPSQGLLPLKPQCDSPPTSPLPRSQR